VTELPNESTARVIPNERIKAIKWSRVCPVGWGRSLKDHRGFAVEASDDRVLARIPEWHVSATRGTLLNKRLRDARSVRERTLDIEEGSVLVHMHDECVLLQTDDRHTDCRRRMRKRGGMTATAFTVRKRRRRFCSLSRLAFPFRSNYRDNSAKYAPVCLPFLKTFKTESIVHGLIKIAENAWLFFEENCARQGMIDSRNHSLLPCFVSFRF